MVVRRRDWGLRALTTIAIGHAVPVDHRHEMVSDIDSNIFYFEIRRSFILSKWSLMYHMRTINIAISVGWPERFEYTGTLTSHQDSLQYRSRSNGPLSMVERLSIQMIQWDLMLWWAKDTTIGSRTINAGKRSTLSSNSLVVFLIWHIGI